MIALFLPNVCVSCVFMHHAVSLHVHVFSVQICQFSLKSVIMQYFITYDHGAKPAGMTVLFMPTGCVSCVCMKCVVALLVNACSLQICHF